MIRWLQAVRRVLSGERRHQPRQNAERAQVVNRQYAVAQKLARRLGTTPEALLDYRRADAILGERRR